MLFLRGLSAAIVLFGLGCGASAFGPSQMGGGDGGGFGDGGVNTDAIGDVRPPPRDAIGKCGNGIVDPGEQCDDGASNSDAVYGAGCTTQCQLAPFCGDGVVNGPEECDLGLQQNHAVYGDMDGCTPSCTRPHYCGDGIVDSADGEQCDTGAANGKGGYCTSTCMIVIL
jgi:cysteine-rich repeat protein